MPGLNSLVKAMVALGWIAAGSALPGLPRISSRGLAHYEVARRQAATSGLTDIDILQFALTLENLETAFYEQGFAKFPDSDFTALGLSATALTNLKSIGQTEQQHVTTLLSAISGADTQPVQSCVYDFGFTTAAAMVGTAGTLENIGVSAYLGAASLLTTPSILSTAATILTVEARHQTFVRAASSIAAVPSAFDTPLGVRSVFSLAAPFITSCPQGSNLNIEPFAPLTPASATAKAVSAAPVAAGTVLEMETQATGGVFCAFSNGGSSAGGAVFVPFVNSACDVPQNLAGITYVHLTSAAPETGVVTDDIIVAGPMVVAIS